MGYVGLSLADLKALSPAEFMEVLKARAKADQDAWERTRILAAITVQPYSKKRVDPRQLIPLPWDEPTAREPEQLTPEQRRKRVAELLKSNG